MNVLERSSARLSRPSRQLPTWWRQNRSWALPTGVLAILLPLIAVGSCAGTVLTIAFGTIRLGASLRKHDRIRHLLDDGDDRNDVDEDSPL